MNYDRMLYILRVWGMFIAVWPLNSKAGKLKTFFYNFFWFICIAFATNQCCLLIKSTFPFNQKNFIKIILELIISVETIFNFLYCKIQRQQLQKLLFDIEQCVQTWTPYQKTIREKFMHKTCAACLSLITIFFIGILLFIILPITHSRILPLDIIYPFSISKSWVYYVAYTMEIFFFAQSSIVMFVDIVITAILWQAAFKFNMLGMQIHSVVTSDKLRALYYNLSKIFSSASFSFIFHNFFSYVREIDGVVGYIFLKLTIVSSICIISSGLLTLNNASIVEISIFFLGTFFSIWRFFICCWAAQAVTDMSYDISWQIYNSPWINTSPNVRRTILMIIQRCQKPVVISGTKFIPVISIRFYGSVLSTTMSYFMALRTILH